MAFLAKFTFGHHLPLVTVPLCWNIFSSCKLNCPSGAILHLMKMTPWHRTHAALMIHLAAWAYLNNECILLLSALESDWMSSTATFWPAFGWTYPFHQQAPERTRTKFFFFWEWIKCTEWLIKTFEVSVNLKVGICIGFLGHKSYKFRF